MAAITMVTLLQKLTSKVLNGHILHNYSIKVAEQLYQLFIAKVVGRMTSVIAAY